MDALIVTEEDKIAIQKTFKTNKDYLERDVQILREWFKKQPHLPQNIQDDAFFEKFLIRNKCLVERTKEKLDNYYTIRTIHKNIFNGYGEIIPSKSAIYFLPFPKLTKNKERIIFAGIRNPDPSTHNLEEIIKIMISSGEIMLKYDYFTAVRLVIDFKGAAFDFLKKIDLILLTTFVKVYPIEFSSRVTGVECVNIPTFFSFGLNILKNCLKAKIFERIRTHDSLDSLFEAVPKELFPKEYGGKEFALEELVGKWDNIFQLHQEYFKTVESETTNENLRQDRSKFMTDMMGVEGTFKKLNID